MSLKTGYDSKYKTGCTWIRRVIHDRGRAQCVACHCTFLIDNGESLVKRHENSEKCKDNMRNFKCQTKLANQLTSLTSSSEPTHEDLVRQEEALQKLRI